jgi:hypothetical protein
MIKASAVAGAAAWTAPVIIDSLASPAAAATVGPCVKQYYARIDFSGCSDIGNGNACFTKTGTLGCGVSPGGNPTVSNFNTSYYLVTLQDGCQFTNTSEVAQFGGGSCKTVTGSATCDSGSVTGNGCFLIGGQTAFITTDQFSHVDIEYCCPS